MNPNARTWSHLSAFKRDAIVAVFRRGGVPGADPDDRPYGLAIKRELEVMRDEEVNHGRLYPNLDDLVDAGLLRKGERDKRTNTYHATGDAVDAIGEYLSAYVGVDVVDPGGAARQAFDDQTSRERGEPVTDGGTDFDFSRNEPCPECDSDDVVFNIAFGFHENGLPNFVIEARCRDCDLERSAGFPPGGSN